MERDQKSRINEGTVISPGRVNLLGEHVDYNDGLVLPAAIDRHVTIRFQPSVDDVFRLHALDLGETCQFHLSRLEGKLTSAGNPLPAWATYPAGVIWNLRRKGYPVIPFHAEYSSNIPIGAGLSSSAAVEVGFAVVCECLSSWRLDRVTMARICQEAEQVYVGVNCGLMDQFACACGVEDHALLFDTRSFVYQRVPLPANTTLVIADSTMRRSLLNSAYNDRRRDCETVAAYFRSLDPNVKTLRDVPPLLLYEHEEALPPVIFRHSRHVVEEIERVKNAVVMLQNGDGAGFGASMFETHASLRYLYEVSIPQLDTLVEIAASIRGCLGARLTGAGFGGCTANLVEKSSVPSFIEQLERVYFEKTGLRAHIFATRPSTGAHLV